MDAMPMTTLPPIAGAARGYRLPDAVTRRDTAVVRVSDFAALMKVIAAHDLWGALAAEMAGQGCTSFRIGAQPMRVASAVLRRRLAKGDLAADAPILFTACSSIGGDDNGVDGAGRAGGVEGTGAVEAGESAKAGEVIPVGESRGSKDKPQ